MIRVALLGCGTMGRVHSGAYAKIPGASLVAVCDLQETKAAAVAAASGAKVFADFGSMMKGAEFDVLDVCLPTYLHREYAEKAMRAGKHVFCEKPVALTLEDARSMAAAADAAGVKFGVGHVLRYFPVYRSAADMAKEGRLGTPRLIRTTRNQAFPGWSWENWYADPAKGGGPIVDLVIHDFDWIIHNFGDVERVYAKSFGGKVERQDHCMCVLRLANGAIAHVEGSWAYPAGSAFRMTFEVVGTAGQVEYDSVADASVVKQTNDGTHRIQYGSPVHGLLEPYAAEIAAFLDCVENGKEPPVDGAQAIKALEVALAAAESSRTGLPVAVGKAR